MSIRLAFGVVLASVLCLFSAPIYEQVSWKGGVPAAIRESVTMIEPGQNVTDTIHGIERYHALRVPANRSLRIELNSDRFDPMLALYRATKDSLELLGQDDDSGEGNNALLERCVEHEGIYVIRVSSFGSSNREGPYTVHSVATSANCAQILEAARQREAEAERQQELEAQRRRDEAVALYRGRPVRIGEPVNGRLGSDSRRTPDGKPFEAWDLSCAAGETFQLDITGYGYDSYAIVVDSAGNQVASNDDGGGSLNPQLTYTCNVAGTYHLISTTYTANSGVSGNYRMSVTRR
jgi:hypothetical protein